MAKRTRKTFLPQHHPFRMGRKRPLARCPRFSLRNYLMKDVAPPPASCDYSSQAAKTLSQMYLNDRFGDCVIAGIGLRGRGADRRRWATSSSTPMTKSFSSTKRSAATFPAIRIPTQAATSKPHWNYWQHNGAPSGTHKIAGWVAVNGADPNEYRTALWLFENLYFGLEPAPDKWVSPMPSKPGFTWDVAGPPNPDNGHCVVGVGYSNKGVKICTWGMLGTLTDKAVEKYATTTGSGELYTVISQDAINKATQKAPAGI